MRPERAKALKYEKKEMMTISLTTIIAGAVVVLLAILGSLINPFLRSLRFTDIAENEENPAEEESLESREPIS